MNHWHRIAMKIDHRRGLNRINWPYLTWYPAPLSKYWGWIVDCPTQLTLYDLDLSVVFHDKYQWEIWKNTAGKSARGWSTHLNGENPKVSLMNKPMDKLAKKPIEMLPYLKRHQLTLIRPKDAIRRPLTHDNHISHKAYIHLRWSCL